MQAGERFLAESDKLMLNTRCERYMVTLDPKGYLACVDPRQLPSMHR
jgi:hypothetical protein